MLFITLIILAVLLFQFANVLGFWFWFFLLWVSFLGFFSGFSFVYWVFLSMFKQNYAVVSLVPCTMALLLWYLPFGCFGMHKQFKCRQVIFLHVVLYDTIWHASFFNTFVYRMNAENANSVVKPFAWFLLNLHISWKPFSNQVIKICLWIYFAKEFWRQLKI